MLAWALEKFASSIMLQQSAAFGTESSGWSIFHVTDFFLRAILEKISKSNFWVAFLAGTDFNIGSYGRPILKTIDTEFSSLTALNTDGTSNSYLLVHICTERLAFCTLNSVHMYHKVNFGESKTEFFHFFISRLCQLDA